VGVYNFLYGMGLRLDENPKESNPRQQFCHVAAKRNHKIISSP
jgi:hypothetical protein